MPETESNLHAQRLASSHGAYLYCFAHRAAVGRIAAPGVDDDTAVAALTVAEVVAVFSPVCVATFSGPSGEANLRDVSWIGPRARRHERVVEEVMRLSPVLPVRFGTVFSSVAALERLTVRSAGPIRDFLEQIAGREEWSLKAFVDVPRAEAWLQAAQAAPNAAPERGPVSPGLRYLRDRQFHLHARQQLEDWSRRTAEEVRQSLAARTVGFRPLRLPSKETSGRDQKMVLHCAWLVLKDRVVEWRERAAEVEARYADRGLSLSLCGPWPPYSFCPSVFDAGRSE